MRARTVLLVFVLGAIAVFAALNWSAFMTPTSLSLGFATVQGPLGLIMLGLTALVTVLFLAFVVYLQTSVLIDARRHARELKAQRELADEAETSRFTELRGFVEEGLQRLEGQCEESRTGVLARLDQLERELRSAVEQAGNTLAAYIGELEDRIAGGTGGRSPSAST
ncbi:MAG: Signal transduction histidine kinase [Deltaproteobacteria bacterium]|jgi:uncharacterized integral membrane protein|nr:Signal transduction histidine kinase [Deltaproteobacteria bacterium]